MKSYVGSIVLIGQTEWRILYFANNGAVTVLGSPEYGKIILLTSFVNTLDRHHMPGLSNVVDGQLGFWDYMDEEHG